MTWIRDFISSIYEGGHCFIYIFLKEFCDDFNTIFINFAHLTIKTRICCQLPNCILQINTGKLS